MFLFFCIPFKPPTRLFFLNNARVLPAVWHFAVGFATGAHQQPMGPGPQIANASQLVIASHIANAAHVANAAHPGGPGRDSTGTAKTKLLERIRANARVFPSCKIPHCDKGNLLLAKKNLQ